MLPGVRHRNTKSTGLGNSRGNSEFSQVWVEKCMALPPKVKNREHVPLFFSCFLMDFEPFLYVWGC